MNVPHSSDVFLQIESTSHISWAIPLPLALLSSDTTKDSSAGHTEVQKLVFRKQDSLKGDLIPLVLSSNLLPQQIHSLGQEVTDLIHAHMLVILSMGFLDSLPESLH